MASFADASVESAAATKTMSETYANVQPAIEALVAGAQAQMAATKEDADRVNQTANRTIIWSWRSGSWRC